MRKCIAVILLLLISTSGIFCEEDEYKDLIPEEYSEDEFPDSLNKLRRSEIIFFGSYPFSLLFTKIAYDFGEYAASGFSQSYAPQIFGGTAQDSPTNKETKNILLTAMFVSLGFSVLDYYIGEIKEKKEAENESRNRSY